MKGFNKVILIGNLTRDPELRYTPKGTAVAKIGIAVSRVWRDDSGQNKEETIFVDIDAWGKQAETISQYLKKGKPLLVEGRLKMDSWDDKQSGQKRSRLGVTLESFQFLDSKSEAQPELPTASVQHQARNVANRNFNQGEDTDSKATPSQPEPEEDDVPF